MVVNIIMHFSLIFTQVNTKHKTPSVKEWSKKELIFKEEKKTFKLLYKLNYMAFKKNGISNQSKAEKKYKILKTK